MKMTAEQQKHYDHCIAQGTSATLAEMFALQRGPTLNTDSTFLAGEETGYKYIHQLADYPGDPKARVSGRGDIQRICEERGFGCSGAVNVKGSDKGRSPAKEIGMAPDLVEQYTDRAIAADPGLAEKPREEVKEKVVKRHRPHWAKKE